MTFASRKCPRCNLYTDRSNCCGIDLTVRRRPWRMTPDKIKHVRAIAHGRKGLDDETYRMYLERTGARSTRELTQDQFYALLKDLARVPDVRRAGAGGAR